MSDIIFRPALVEEVPLVRGLIKTRIDFLRTHDIHPSWADRDYLNIFSEDYFVHLAQKKHLIIAVKEEKIIACAGIHEADFPRWDNDGVHAFYIHNLCSLPQEKNIGSGILKYCILLAKEKGKKAVRLDSIEGNIFLESFYRKNGFTFLKNTNDNGFKCLLWEMRI